MPGKQTAGWPQQQKGILACVILAHALLLLVFTIGMSPTTRPSHKPSVQLPVPLPMAMVEIISTPNPSGAPKPSAHPQALVTPSTVFPSSPKSSLKAVPKSIAPIIKKEHPTQSIKTKFAPIESKTAITINRQEGTIAHNQLNQTAPTSNNTLGNHAPSEFDSNQQNSAPHPQNTGFTAQHQNSPAGPSTAPSFGAAYLKNPAPKYPSSARRNKEQGKVLLRVFVSGDGLAKQVQLYAGSGSSSLDDAAITAVKKWRFVPAKQGSETVEAWVQVPVVFKLDS